MLYLTTILWCIPSPLILVINAEAWVLGQAALNEVNPTLLGLAAAAGQVIGYTLCFFGGEAVLRRLPKLHDKVAAFDVDKHRGAAYGALFVGSVVGMPPAVVLTLVGRALHYRFLPYFVVCAAGRIIRFETLAWMPDLLGPLFKR